MSVQEASFRNDHSLDSIPGREMLIKAAHDTLFIMQNILSNSPFQTWIFRF